MRNLYSAIVPFYGNVRTFAEDFFFIELEKLFLKKSSLSFYSRSNVSLLSLLLFS